MPATDPRAARLVETVRADTVRSLAHGYRCALAENGGDRAAAAESIRAMFRAAPDYRTTVHLPGGGPPVVLDPADLIDEAIVLGDEPGALS
jgi:hypothetical protein